MHKHSINVLKLYLVPSMVNRTATRKGQEDPPSPGAHTYMAFMRVCRSFHEDGCMLSLLCYNTHTSRCVCKLIIKGAVLSNPSALSRRMWGSFNTSNRNYTALQVSQDGDGFILLHTFPWWNLPTSRHKPIKADENAVIYQTIMLPPAHVCVCVCVRGKRANDSLETDT